MNYEKEDLSDFLDNELKEISLNKRGQPRRRKEKQPRVYFTAETEENILKYLASDDENERNKIYREHIEYAFYKLAENIIHTFKFYHTDSDSIEDLKHEVITVILEKLHLFHPAKNINDRVRKIHKVYSLPYNNEFEQYAKRIGKYEITNPDGTINQIEQIHIDGYIDNLCSYITTLKKVDEECIKSLKKITPPKAFSYFGTIVKRYLINYNKDNYEKLQEYTPIENLDEDKNFIKDNVYDPNDTVNTDNFITQFVMYIDKNLNIIFPKSKDAKTADAIIELFRKRETLEIFNKKALYIYIREMTDVSTPQITKVTKKLDNIRLKLFNHYYKHGYIKI